MKTIAAFATGVLGLSAVACSDEADLGIDSSPLECSTEALAEVGGSVTYGGQSYDFDVASPSVSLDPNGASTTLSLFMPIGGANDGGNILRFNFTCGPTEVASYGVVDGRTQQGPECPFEVFGALLGNIEYLPAKEGTVIVDQNASCLAGRFRVDFENDRGDGGAIGGWFSVPWQ